MDNNLYAMMVSGDSMASGGIRNGDVLVVDRARDAHDGDAVIAVLDGELAIKRLRHINGRMLLHADNPQYPDYVPADGSPAEIWGVVTGIFHDCNAG
ncbi:LexA family protein [Bifidobacterium oedipodis]|uniref:ImpA n=1 Tax=Bifidobacterium oedipodis TaxID=2675322 RepID=A0A7Y0ENF4_9BIFI|nr:S24 family peptidase [Bifidobacterium sp. DSM 109957]NMM93524.1 ImpA [Bifidobacterium sp. DSM 109957]